MTDRLILISEVHEPALLQPLAVLLLGVLDGLHDAHQRDVGAGRGRRAATYTDQRSPLRGVGGDRGAVVADGTTLVKVALKSLYNRSFIRLGGTKTKTFSFLDIENK